MQSTAQATYKRNALSGLLQYGVLTLLTLAVVLYFPEAKGDEAFGVYAGISVIGNLTIFANLGLNHALIRLIASQGKSQETFRDIVANSFLSCGVGLMVTLVCLLSKDWYLAQLHVPAVYHDQGIDGMYVCLSLGNFFFLVGQPFVAILDGSHKIYLTNRVQLWHAVLLQGGTLAVLFFGGDFSAIGLVAFAASLLWALVMISMALRDWGRMDMLVLDGGWQMWASVRKQLGYGLQIYASSAINFFYEPLTKILTASLFGVVWVGIFELGLKVRGQLWGISYKILYPLFPAFSESQAIAEERAMILKAQRYQLFALLGMVMGLAGLSGLAYEWLVSLPYLDEKIAAILSMSAGYLLFSAGMIPVNFWLNAKGKAWVMIIAQLINVGVNLALLYLCRPLGFGAVLLANVGSIACSYGYLLFMQQRLIGPLTGFFRQGDGLSLALAAGLIGLNFYGWGWPLLIQLMLLLISGLTFLAIVWLRVLEPDVREKAKSILAKVGKPA